MSAQREPGIEYGLWWLAAVLVLPMIDVALVVVVDGVLVSGTAVSLALSVVAAAVTNAFTLRVWGGRLGISTGTVLTATFVSYLVAIVVFLIFVYAVVAPQLA